MTYSTSLSNPYAYNLAINISCSRKLKVQQVVLKTCVPDLRYCAIFQGVLLKPIALYVLFKNGIGIYWHYSFKILRQYF